MGLGHRPVVEPLDRLDEALLVPALAGDAEVVEAGAGILVIHQGIGAVDQQKVDPVDLQPFQPLLDPTPDDIGGHRTGCRAPLGEGGL